ncbi:MAG: HAD family hydrolase [Clostridia bacterium]|nr:HAD family hydrolase [Clostridia bacterium]
MIKACLFDLDGTLCNTLTSIAYFGNTALNEYGLPSCDIEDYRIMVGNGRDKLIERMLNKSAGECTEEMFDKVGTLYDTLYAEKPLHLVEPYEGVPELLAYLKENCIKAAVLSNKPDDMTKLVVKGILGDDNFEIVQGSLPQFPKKPDPTAPLDILKRLGVSPDEALYIGDSGVDIKTGRNSGMKSVGCSWGFRGPAELRENNADYIVNTCDEIIKIIQSL